MPPETSSESPVVIGITGAQGVGKSTYCRALAEALKRKSPVEVYLASGLGERLKARGIPLGSAATADSVAAVFAAHIERALEPAKGVVLLDRCVVDAFAYVRALRLTSAVQTELYGQVSALMARSLRLVVHLEMRGIFLDTAARHESASLRAEIACLIPTLVTELGVPHISTCAAEPDAVEVAALKIIEVSGLAPLDASALRC